MQNTTTLMFLKCLWTSDCHFHKLKAIQLLHFYSHRDLYMKKNLQAVNFTFLRNKTNCY